MKQSQRNLAKEIAELVPSETRNLLLRVCFGYASQPHSLLAMMMRGIPRNDTEGNMSLFVYYCEPFFSVIASDSEAI